MRSAGKAVRWVARCRKCGRQERFRTRDEAYKAACQHTHITIPCQEGESMSIVELDGGDAKKMLDDLQDAKGLAAEVANGGAPSMDKAHDLARRLGRSKDLLARAMVAEKMGDVKEQEDPQWRECPVCNGSGRCRWCKAGAMHQLVYEAGKWREDA